MDYSCYSEGSGQDPGDRQEQDREKWQLCELSSKKRKPTNGNQGGRVTSVRKHCFRHSDTPFQANTRMKATARAILSRNASRPETSVFSSRVVLSLLGNCTISGQDPTRVEDDLRLRIISLAQYFGREGDAPVAPPFVAPHSLGRLAAEAATPFRLARGVLPMNIRSSRHRIRKCSGATWEIGELP